MFNIQVESKENGIVDLRLRDVEIVNTYRLNDLGFWVRYRSSTGTGKPGQFFVSEKNRLVVFEDQITEWKPGA